MQYKTQGKYVIFEGVDYASKSSVLYKLLEYLNQKNQNVHIYKQPGSTWIGNKIREIVKCPESKISDYIRAMLFIIDNISFHEDILKLSTEDWILLDRNNFISSLVYQVNDGICKQDLIQAFKLVKNKRIADHLFIFDINWDTRCQRAKIRNDKPDHFERDKIHFEMLRSRYLDIYNNGDAVEFSRETHLIDANRNTDAILDEVVSYL